MSTSINQCAPPWPSGLFSSDVPSASRRAVDSGEASFGQQAGVTTDNAHQGQPLLQAFPLWDDDVPGAVGAWPWDRHGMGCRMVWNLVISLQGGGGVSSKGLFLESVCCGMMMIYMLQCIRIKSEWKEASSTQDMWKAFISCWKPCMRTKASLAECFQALLPALLLGPTAFC